MNKRLLCLSTLLYLFFTATTLQAQTALSTGDIAFTGYNSALSDNFSFVIIRTGGIAANTIIRFTNRGWYGVAPNTACSSNGWATATEQEIVWTSAVAIPYGRQISIQGLTATYPYGAGGTVTGTPLSLSSNGDQIIASHFNTIIMQTVILSAIHMNVVPGVTTTSGNWDNVTSAPGPNTNESNRPTCITNGTHGLVVHASGVEVDNARVNASVILSGNPATDRSRINNIANWQTSDGAANEFSLPGNLAGLPVDFTWIKATEKGGQVQVDFGVGTEEEILEYVIEKSADGRLYSSIGSVAASRRSSYSFADIKPLAGTNFYRIKAVEINGTTKYSTIANINLSKTGRGIGVYPGIVRNNQFTLQITNLPAGSYRMNIHSAVGQLVLSRTINHGGGSSTQTVNLPASTQKGVYKVRLTGNAENAVTTIVIE